MKRGFLFGLGSFLIVVIAELAKFSVIDAVIALIFMPVSVVVIRRYAMGRWTIQ